MKLKIMKMILCLAGLFSATGCEGTSYLEDRFNDFWDIPSYTFLGGEPCIGVEVRFGPFGVMLGKQEAGFGLKNGEHFIIGPSQSEGFPYGWGTLVFPLYSEASSKKVYGELYSYRGSVRGKSYLATMVFPFYYSAEPHYDGPAYPCHFLTQLEISASFFIGASVGLNPGEALDFILGWLTIDIYGDDKIYNYTPEKEPKDTKEDSEGET